MIFPSHIRLDRFDWPHILRMLDTVGAISFPFLTDDVRFTLIKAARHLAFIPQRREVSGGLVRQEIESCNAFSRDSIFQIFAAEYDAFLRSAYDRLARCPFTRPFEINDISVQRYAPGSLGITPHVDGMSHRNMVSLIFLTGQGDFYACANRSGDRALPIDTSPGHILLMRANGYREYTNTPFHFVKNISTERYVLGLRQKSTLKTAE